MPPHRRHPRPLNTACHSRFNYFSMSLRILELGKREGVIVNLCVCVCVERRKIRGRLVERGVSRERREESLFDLSRSLT
jgi:hypothetical protein